MSGECLLELQEGGPSTAARTKGCREALPKWRRSRPTLQEGGRVCAKGLLTRVVSRDHHRFHTSLCHCPTSADVRKGRTRILMLPSKRKPLGNGALHTEQIVLPSCTSRDSLTSSSYRLQSARRAFCSVLSRSRLTNPCPHSSVNRLILVGAQRGPNVCFGRG